MYLFFDTETTGLPKSWSAPITDLKNWPRMVQLAYIQYDQQGNKIIQGNFIIKPEGFSIPTESSNIHGITTQRALKEGKDLKESLILFNELVEKSSTLVAHNISFDEKILGAEFLRQNMGQPLEYKRKFCTMNSTKDFCQIPTPYGFKKPKLSELYQKLFNSDLLNAHDAYIDVEATAKCFWKLRQMGIL
ncbi:hypothetical protein SF1_38740 [Sphingobacterium faecium NBRC 15299]|uniref:3'-5' exonuclease n=1 Tax=Sphingobacterium faecium TaxID=34087 RepID=UPI000D37C480|nr:3'-5' exonuclease [Sphingobacterium faecium]PTX07560.1 DNA polymerase-3 subunit epsilon [Sphingobacterium faecium]GEM65892.1 hypothetical protein SF1_38740 [Sphingobacterium faecium NBRC 15299]